MFELSIGTQGAHKNSESHIDASHSRQPLVKGERLVRYEVNAVMPVDLARIVFDDSFEKNKLQQQKEKPTSTRRARMVPGEGGAWGVFKLLSAFHFAVCCPSSSYLMNVRE